MAQIEYPNVKTPTFDGLTPLPGRVRLMTLLILRWLAIAGQLIALFAVHFGFGYTVPLVPCLAVIAASALLNALVSLGAPATKRLSSAETMGYLAFDIAQLSILLALTGGLQNPFAVLMVAPVVIAAATLPPRRTVLLLTMALTATTLLALVYWPLPWDAAQPLQLPAVYILGLWFALMIGLSFTTAYVWRIGSEARRMSDALAATENILIREHQMGALGSLAAAAAHELGTPLATIAVVANELRREVPPDGPLAEDVALLASQAQRCREILNRLSVKPDEEDALFGRVPLGSLLHEVIEPHRDLGIDIQLRLSAVGGDGEADAGAMRDGEPLVAHCPELRHGLGNLIENAVDFARHTVIIDARWDAERIVLSIADDGPGFAPAVIDRLGEPYVTTRPSRGQPRHSDDNGQPEGMGLGFFIAKTLIERIGGRIRFGNRSGAGGALVDVSWPREPSTKWS